MALISDQRLLFNIIIWNICILYGNLNEKEKKNTALVIHEMKKYWFLVYTPFHPHWQWLSNSDDLDNLQILQQKSVALDYNRYALRMVQYLANNHACVLIILIKYRHIAIVFLIQNNKSE